MNNLLIVGAGGHGKVVADTARLTSEWNRIAFLDDRYPELHVTGYWPIIGTLTQLNELINEFSHILVAIGNNDLRIRLLEKSKQLGYQIATIIHPSAYVSQHAIVNQGTVVFAQSAINIGSVIGNGCIINTGATIDHDCQIADGVHISPGVHLAGEVRIGAGSWIGIGASVIQQVSIGKNAIVGAGAAIIRDIPDNVTVVGVPGIIVKSRE